MIFSAWQEKAMEGRALPVAGGGDGVIDLRRFTGGRGGSTFAHGGYGGLRFFAAGNISQPARRSPRYQ
jgi:hypothetical protein